MDFAMVFLAWMALCITVGVFAHNRGRFGFGWAIISFMLSPLVGGIIIALMPKAGKAAMPRDESGAVITQESHTRCPDCRELVRVDARKCKHCGAALVPQ